MYEEDQDRTQQYRKQDPERILGAGIANDPGKGLDIQENQRIDKHNCHDGLVQLYLIDIIYDKIMFDDFSQQKSKHAKTDINGKDNPARYDVKFREHRGDVLKQK